MFTWPRSLMRWSASAADAGTAATSEQANKPSAAIIELGRMRSLLGPILEQAHPLGKWPMVQPLPLSLLFALAAVGCVLRRIAGAASGSNAPAALPSEPMTLTDLLCPSCA